jgi:arginyl-tRNA synthetase
MLSLSGNTAPYMLYAYARIQGIRRKVAESSSLNIDINVLKETDSSKLVFLKNEEVFFF